MKVVKIVEIESVNNTQVGLSEANVGEFVAVSSAHVGDKTHHLTQKLGEVAVDSKGTHFEIEAWGENHFDCWDEALASGFMVEG